MCKLLFSEWIYIFSISFQLSGAVILLLKYCFVNMDDGIMELSSRKTRVEDGNLILGEYEPTESEYRENIWLNRIAFAFLAAGYLSGVWGSVGDAKRGIVFGMIVVLSALITVLSYLIIKKLTRVKKAN